MESKQQKGLPNDMICISIAWTMDWEKLTSRKKHTASVNTKTPVY